MPDLQADLVAAYLRRCWNCGALTPPHLLDAGDLCPDCRRTPRPVDWTQLDAEVERVRAEAEALDAERDRGRAAAVAALRRAATARDLAAAELAAAVKLARAAGVTWAAIGAALGMSRQAAHERWTR